MKPASNNPLSRWIALVGTLPILLAPQTMTAATYQWDGSDSPDWVLGANWVPGGPFNGQTITAGPAPTGGTFAHRININNGTGNEAVYSASQGTTVYANGTANRGLVIGSGTPNAGTLRITGGTLSTVGSGGAGGSDVIGNGSGNSATLIIDGGEYLASTTVGMGIGGGPTSTFTLNSGSATIPTLHLNNTTGTLNLNGGILAATTITRSGGTNTLNFNGGTLKARVASPTFIADLVNTTAWVKSGGAVIDTSGDSGTGVDVTISEPLIEDPSSTGGGLTKHGDGLLTLGAPSTITGDIVIHAGGLGVRANALDTWYPSNFTHSGDTLNFSLGAYDPSNPVVIDVLALTIDSAVTVNVTGTHFQVGQIPLIQYQSKSVTGSLTLNPSTLPAGVAATLKDDDAGLIYLDVTQAATPYEWSGDFNTPGTGAWDTTSLNWNGSADAYSTAGTQVVQFPDITGGGTVTVMGDFSPLQVAISNAGGNSYLFGGTGRITGTAEVIKSGTGIATFANPNDYSGPTTISAGVLVKGAADATTGDITVATNAAFGLSGGIASGAGQTLSLSGPGLLAANGVYAAVQRGALTSISGNNTWEGDILVPTASTGIRIGVQDGAQLTLSGSITEAVAGTTLIFRHGGTAGSNIIISGTGNHWTGETQIFGGEGAVILGADNVLPTGSHLRVGTLNIAGTGSTLDLNGSDQACAGLSRVNAGPAFITNNGAAPSTLTVDAAADYAWYGVIQDGSGVVNLMKNGTGKLTLGGANSYSGTTTVADGQLEINADQSATGDIIINGGSVKLSSVKHLATGVNVSIASGAFFYLDGSSQTLGKLEGSGTVDCSWTAAGVDTLTVGANDATSTFDGVIRQSTARTYALTKTGTGTFTMTGLSSYTGGTTIEDGTLSVAEPNFADTSTVTIGTVADAPAVLNLPNAGTDIVAALVIDGVSQAGDGEVYDSTNTGGAITGAGKIQVGTTPSGFGTWIAGTFANGASVPSDRQGPNDDPENDGIDNLLEFVLNGDPTVADAGILPNLVVTATEFEFTYQRRDDSVAPETTQTFEWGTTLAAWPGSAAVPATSGSVPPATITVSAGTPDDGVTDTVKVSIPRTEDGGSGKLFGRLKVEQ